jgi:hypothetical protein
LVEEGFVCVLEHGNRGARRLRKLDDAAEAHLIALACTQAPEGRNRWTVRLLAEKMVALGHVDSCGKSTIHRTLKKRTQASPEQILVYPVRCERRIRRGHGRCVGGLPGADGSLSPAGLSGRSLQTARR